ncbi:hypothetical protein SOPP22_14705 [Shewanella sp. OPT22]|nr:hypothetical protein SOPP22_14705 [Shewanella sp. OPT22]
MSEVLISPNNKVVAIGGGHGLPQVLKAFSFLGNNLSAIVTTTDNGGSSGRLRKINNNIAWGDIRNCISSLVDDELSQELLSFRFPGKIELGGHNLGNIIFTALEQMGNTPSAAIRLIKNLLNIKANIYPMTEEVSDLKAVLEDNSIILGETQIDDLQRLPRQITLHPKVQALNPAIKSISEADIIILGPGSFFSSILPPLLIERYAQAINQSKAKIFFIDNILPEQSLAKLMSLADKAAYLQTLINREVDCIISTNREENTIKNIITTDDIKLASNYHCSSALATVISHYYYIDKAALAI